MTTPALSLPAAMTPNGALADAMSATRGEDHSCPRCARQVILKRGAIRRAHFAHAAGSECTGESVLHAAAKHTLAAALRGAIRERRPYPIRYVCRECGGAVRGDAVKTLCEVETERQIGAHARCDIVGSDAERPRVAFEVVVTHEMEHAAERECLDREMPVLVWRPTWEQVLGGAERGPLNVEQRGYTPRCRGAHHKPWTWERLDAGCACGHTLTMLRAWPRRQKCRACAAVIAQPWCQEHTRATPRGVRAHQHDLRPQEDDAHAVWQAECAARCGAHNVYRDAGTGLPELYCRACGLYQGDYGWTPLSQGESAGRPTWYVACRVCGIAPAQDTAPRPTWTCPVGGDPPGVRATPAALANKARASRARGLHHAMQTPRYIYRVV